MFNYTSPLAGRFDYSLLAECMGFHLFSPNTYCLRICTDDKYCKDMGYGGCFPIVLNNKTLGVCHNSNRPHKLVNRTDDGKITKTRKYQVCLNSLDCTVNQYCSEDHRVCLPIRGKNDPCYPEIDTCPKPYACDPKVGRCVRKMDEELKKMESPGERTCHSSKECPKDQYCDFSTEIGALQRDEKSVTDGDDQMDELFKNMMKQGAEMGKDSADRVGVCKRRSKELEACSSQDQCEDGFLCETRRGMCMRACFNHSDCIGAKDSMFVCQTGGQQSTGFCKEERNMVGWPPLEDNRIGQFDSYKNIAINIVSVLIVITIVLVVTYVCKLVLIGKKNKKSANTRNP